MKLKRIEWIDIAKFICIMFVMLSHLESKTSFLSTFFTPFFLTLFFFCSGYVYSNKDNFKSFMYKKFRGLFIPWLVFSFFNIFLSHIISFNNHLDIMDEIKWNILQIRTIHDGLWFIAALFVAFIPFYFFINWYNTKLKGKSIILLLISFILSFISIIYSKYMNPSILPWNSTALPWHIEYIFQAMFFMIIGYLFREKYEKTFDKINTLINRMLLLIFYLVIRYTVFVFNIEFTTFVQIIYDYISQLLGIVTVIAFCKVIKTNKFISYVGQNTLIYFALHGKVYSLLQTILRRTMYPAYMYILNNTLYSSLLSIILTLILSIILIIPAWIINRYFPFILGRKYINNKN